MGYVDDVADVWTERVDESLDCGGRGGAREGLGGCAWAQAADDPRLGASGEHQPRFGLFAVAGFARLRRAWMHLQREPLSSVDVFDEQGEAVGKPEGDAVADQGAGILPE